MGLNEQGGGVDDVGGVDRTRGRAVASLEQGGAAVRVVATGRAGGGHGGRARHTVAAQEIPTVTTHGLGPAGTIENDRKGGGRGMRKHRRHERGC